MLAKSIKGKSSEEIQSALEQCIGENFKPTLAIAFISVKQDRDAICEILKNKNIDIFGATSCGGLLTVIKAKVNHVFSCLNFHGIAILFC